MLGGDTESVIQETACRDQGDANSQKWQGEIELKVNEMSRWLDVRVTSIYDRWLEVAGRLLVIRDITAQKTIQQEKEDLIAELRTSLNRVQTLEGLLPICAGCKKIRDDDGYWNHVESYLAAHAQIRFTHGICPECAKTFFPGISPGGPQM
jgi:hypothetical protein